MNSLFANLFSSQTITPASFPTILLSLVLALAAGMFIAWVYKRNYRGVMFSNNFTLTLIMMTLITCPVVMCIRESIQLSMGMVGALSIVRFRTAVKDPLDTAYMFWALTMGILLGAGQFFLIQSKGVNSYLLVVRMGEDAERQTNQLVNGLKMQQLKSKTVSANGIEATYEVRVDKPDAFLNKLRQLPGVYDATLVAYSGEAV